MMLSFLRCGVTGDMNGGRFLAASQRRSFKTYANCLERASQNSFPDYSMA